MLQPKTRPISPREAFAKSTQMDSLINTINAFLASGRRKVPARTVALSSDFTKKIKEAYRMAGWKVTFSKGNFHFSEKK